MPGARRVNQGQDLHEDQNRPGLRTGRQVVCWDCDPGKVSTARGSRVTTAGDVRAGGFSVAATPPPFCFMKRKSADYTTANNVLANRGRRVGGANRCRTTLSIISRQLDVRPLPVPTWAATINQQLRTSTTALAGKRVGGWGKARCCRSTLKLAVFDVHSLPSDDCLGSANYYNTQQLQAQNP